MINVKQAFAGIIAGMIVLFGASGGASAAPVTKSTPSVCKTGHRGMPAYDRACLRSGTFRDGAALWLNLPAGSKGHESREAFNRRSLCKYAHEFGGIRNVAREANNDVAYDRFSNYHTVLNWSASVAVLDCTSMGYRV